MELIRRAVERARSEAGSRVPKPRADYELPSPNIHAPPLNPVETSHEPLRELVLDGRILEKNRIIAHDIAHPVRKSFDVLRTQVLQTMDEKDMHILAVTSPNPGCGKTVTAINLALSIARQPRRSVLLVDMDLQRPRIAHYLGLSVEQGLLSVLEGRTSLPAATMQTRIGSLRFSALLAESPTEDSSAWMTSEAVTELLQGFRQMSHSQIVVIDLPPLLRSDDVMAILPQIDCVLFVTAVGVSTVSEIEECSRHLQSTEIVRIVLNKAPEEAKAYSSGYY